jgi:pimeloyl-ACP methyl ester carboxylesterase
MAAARDLAEMTRADAGDMRRLATAGPGRGRGAARVGAAVVLLAVLAGCSGGSAGGGSGGVPGGGGGPSGTGTEDGLTGVRPCPGVTGFSCGTLSVRLDPFGSAPGRLSLPVAVADAPAPRGVLVFLSGGPGEASMPFLTRLAGRLGPPGYRLVLLDQRGTGSGALDCPALQQEMGASDLTVPTRAAVQACAAALGPRRQYYGTVDTVADLEALRRALGVPKIALDGVSYGTYVAEQFALAHPGEVSRLVLDSVVPAWNVDPLQLENMRHSAEVLRAVCAARHCGFDPAADLATVVRRDHDGPALLDMLVSMSVGAPSFPGVPDALHQAAAGHPAALTALMAQVHRAGAWPARLLSQGLHASTLCGDLRMPWGGPETPLAARPPALARAVGRLTPAQTWPFDRATAAGNGLIRTCLSWPPTPAPPVLAAPRDPLPQVPVLLLAGGRDLSTPLAGARAQTALAPDGRLVVVPDSGHSVQSRATDNAGRQAVGQFLSG